MVDSSQGIAGSVKYSASAARSVPIFSTHQKIHKKQKYVKNGIFTSPPNSGDL
jgi:hypothetical protein